MIKYRSLVAAQKLGADTFVELSAHPSLLYPLADLVDDESAVSVGSGHRNVPITDALSANIAAVACQLARDARGPHISGQVLICPVVDSDMTRPSYQENGDGYILTTALMRWFWDHYADPADRDDPRVAPLRGDLHGLPPTCIVTADFDPLRDEGIAYAHALVQAGTPARHIRARGHTHTSVTMVGVVISGAPVRAELAGVVSQALEPAQVSVWTNERG